MRCEVSGCGFDFESKYGEIAKKVIKGDITYLDKLEI